jgi:stage III sporulation protein AE
MRKMIILCLTLSVILIPVHAIELTPPEVPEFGQSYMPENTSNFQAGFIQILRNTLLRFRPDLKEASRVCLGIIAAVIAVSLIRFAPSGSERTADLAGTVAISGMFLSAAGALVNLGAQTVFEIRNYGKLLLPVLTTALAAQGGITTSSALYAGTALFDAVLSSLVSKILVPMIYLYLAVSATNSALGNEMLKKLRDAVKWFMTWSLKTVLYIFTGYISITGVVSGPTDAAALKAAKLTISGVVPVVGGILSDASEAVLVGAGTVKNAIGLYGLFAVIAIWMEPFLKIGTHYLLLRFTGSICSIFS